MEREDQVMHDDKNSEALDRLADVHRGWCNYCRGDALVCLNAPRGGCALRDYMVALESTPSAEALPTEFTKGAYSALADEIGFVGGSYGYFAKRYWPAILRALKATPNAEKEHLPPALQMAAGNHSIGVFKDGKLIAADAEVYAAPSHVAPRGISPMVNEDHERALRKGARNE
jgi:hypothetical protein